MTTDALVAEIYELMATHYPNNKAMVPIAHSLERDPNTGVERWYAYIEVRTRDAEFDVAGDANNLPKALRNALMSLRKMLP